MAFSIRSSLVFAAALVAVSTVPSRAAGGPNAGDWPALGRTNNHTGVATDPAMTPAKAKTLGVRWMANLYAADLGSPIVAYDATLGKLVVYAGNERGDLIALDAKTGATLWSTNVGPGDSERDTPLFVDGDVFVGTAYNDTEYKLDGATGRILCTSHGPAAFLASPMAATPPGGRPMVFTSTIDEPGIDGPAFGNLQADCSQVFRFTGYVSPTGPWASPSYGIDANGRPLDVFGTADPDAKVYAVNALTGTLAWVFKVKNPAPFVYDVGAAADISPPGVNGFADGVVYVPTKYGIMYALDLTTGAEIWEFNFNADAGASEGGLSAASLAGNDLVFGYNGGMYDLNATTGAKVWRYVDPTGSEVVSGPAVVGTLAADVAAFTDTAGGFRVIRRANATPLYAHQTGGYVVSSPAYASGTFYITSSDGFLYAFSPGGSNAAAPATAVTFPAAAAHVDYRDGDVTITGTATGTGGISGVGVAVQSGGSTGPWYDAATRTWNSGPYTNPATISATSTGATWSLKVPLMPGGGTMTVVANATGTGGVTDIRGTRVAFSTKASKTQPVVKIFPAIAPPGGTTAATVTAFQAGETVTFALAGATLGAAVADGKGAAAVTALAIPADATFGPTALTATGGTSGDVSTATLDVENAWVSLGYDGTRAAYEPNDTVLVRVLHAGPNIFLAPAYFAASTAPVESSPAVYDNVAFFGNDAGTMSAVDTVLGAPVWQYAIPSGAPIVSAPAVDQGVVVFGADDGTLYGASLATGAPTGSVTLGGKLTSPAVANGVVYVASKAGKIYAVSENTGAVLWTHGVGANISSSVTVDAAAGELLVGDDDGFVSAYSLATAGRMWHVHLGGALRVPLSVSGGVVYAGSSDGNVWALTETNGRTMWTYAEGSAITATPVVAPNEEGFTGNAIYVGSADGKMTALNANGTAAYHVPFASAVVGMAATHGNVVIVELANGSVGATRGTNDGFNFYNFQTTGSLDTSPAIVSGAVYVGAGAGGLYAFTPYGRAPLDRTAAAAAHARLRATKPGFVWPVAGGATPHAVPPPAMDWSGANHASLRVLRGEASGTAQLRFHGGLVQPAPRTYVVFWAPPGSTMSPDYRAAVGRALATAHSGPAPAGIALDTAPLPSRPSDAAFRVELARMAAREHWNAGAGAQFVLLPAREAFGGWAGFCAYHGAFSGAPAGSPFVYAVVPYPNGASVCGMPAGFAPTGSVDADLVLPTLARERTDMATDPLGTAWFDAAGREAGDFTTP